MRLRRIIPVLLLLAAVPMLGEGPLYVGGDPTLGIPNSVPGKPFVWTINPLTYWTDKGPASGPALGNQTKAQADQLVADAFKVWEDVPSATITFSKAGDLSADVTSTNDMAVLNDLSDCSTLPGPPAGGIAQPRTIIYDKDGSITQDLTGDKTTTLGFASVVCFSSAGGNNSFERGYAVLNGLFVDGVNTPSNPEVSLTEFKAVFIHEFGHLIGLDHTQVNVNCLNACSADDLAGLPTMFPILVNGTEMSSPAPDDIAGVSELYPDPTFATSTGRIRGRLFFSDGVTQAQGFNLIARQVDDPATPTQDESRRNAVSSDSGFLFTGDEGNPLVQQPGFSPSPFGSHDQTLIGYYEIPGLTPAQYTVEVEAFDPGFTAGSGIGPVGSLGLVFAMPSPLCPTGEFLNASESNSDVCTDSNPLDLTAAGTIIETNTDIILNGTPPRYDAYEDGP